MSKTPRTDAHTEPAMDMDGMKLLVRFDQLARESRALETELAAKQAIISEQHHKFTEDLTELNEELCAKEEEIVVKTNAIAQFARELTDAQAKIEGLKTDAERYRWIAANFDRFLACLPGNTGIEIEVALDTARAQQEKK